MSFTNINTYNECLFKKFLFIILFIIYFFWLCWVFVSVRGLSTAAASGGHSSTRCAGLSLSRPLLLRSAGSAVVVHGPSCSAACGILPDQGSNPCPLDWQADSQPLRHQGSPMSAFYMKCSYPRVSAGAWFQDPIRIPKSADASIPYMHEMM